MLLLEYAVAQHFPWVVHPLAVSIAEGGKPYLVSEPGIHFSLSHSGDWAVCAISDHPVGVDIEWCDPNRRDIASRFFHKDEIRYLNSLPPYARTDAFYSLWTLKESFVKSTGRGLDLPLRSFCVKLRSNTRPQLDCPDMERPIPCSCRRSRPTVPTGWPSASSRRARKILSCTFSTKLQAVALPLLFLSPNIQKAAGAIAPARFPFCRCFIFPVHTPPAPRRRAGRSMRSPCRRS